MEWGAEFEESEPGYRHFSHLYGVFPGNSITTKNKEIFEAARKSLDVRMEHGSGQTGWNCAWVISLYAAFLDGEKADAAVKKQIAESMYLNLMDAHPPFQIDGNFGFTAGICEMLMQSHIDEDDIAYIHILPAIPEGWKEGEVRGIRARGGATLDICWRDGKALVSVKKGKTECQIYSDKFECEII